MARVKSAKDRVTTLQALKLQQSVNTKDVHQIIKLISNGVPNLVNVTDSYEGITAVHIAACSNDVETLKLLDNFKADFNVIDKNGKSAYMKAAEYGHIEALTTLIQLCDFPDLDSEDKDGRNILFYCLHNTKRHQYCLKLAIENGADFHVISSEGKSLLIEACELKLTDITKTLLGEGIDVNVKNQKTGETGLLIACREGLTDVARMLLKHGANPDIGDKNGNHCIHNAAKKNNSDILQLLSAYGANFGVLNKIQETALHVVAQKGNATVCTFLGQRGCPANLKNKKGHTPRALAKNNGHKLAIKACKKAEKNKGQKPGTQFHYIQFYDWLQENTDSLLAAITKYDTENNGEIKTNFLQLILKERKSPLSEEHTLEIIHAHDKTSSGAIDFNLLLTGKKFIHKSCLTKSKKKEKGEKKGGGKKGKKVKATKIGVPIFTNAKATFERIEECGPLANYVERQENITDHFRFNRDQQPRHQIQDDSFWYLNRQDPTYIHMNEAIKNGDRETVKIALHGGYDVNKVDRYYKTPLMLACLDGNYELAKFLVDHGADIRMLDNFKWSAIHFASHSGQTDVMNLLMNNGANIDAQTMNGGTPLMRAIESGNVEAVQLLVGKGAKAYIKNKKGHDALQVAKSYSDLRIVAIVSQRLLDAPEPTENKRKPTVSSGKAGSRQKKGSSSVLPEIKPNGEKLSAKSLTRSGAASALTTSLNEEKPVKFNAQKAWLPQLNTDELLIEKSKKRERYGYEIDFEDYKPPFQKNVNELLNNEVPALT